MCHTARSILNRCETAVLLRKDLQVFLKRLALIWVDSRLCVSGNGWLWWEIIFMGSRLTGLQKRESLVGDYFLANRTLLFGKEIDSDENMKISAFCTQKHLEKSQNLRRCTSLWCYAKPWFYSKLSLKPHWFPVSAATKITCNLPFHRLPAAASLHYNFDFSQNPIPRLIRNFPFAPVQSLKTVLDTNCFKFFQKHTRAEL